MARVKNAAATAEKKTASRNKKTAPVNGTHVVLVGTAVSEEQIRQRAYELFVSRGRQDGAHEADWFAAEAELRSHTA